MVYANLIGASAFILSSRERGRPVRTERAARKTIRGELEPYAFRAVRTGRPRSQQSTWLSCSGSVRDLSFGYSQRRLYSIRIAYVEQHSFRNLAHHFLWF